MTEFSLSTNEIQSQWYDHMAGPVPTKGRYRGHYEQNVAHHEREREANEEARRAEEQHRINGVTHIPDPVTLWPLTTTELSGTPVAREDHVNSNTTGPQPSNAPTPSNTTRRDAGANMTRTPSPTPPRLRKTKERILFLEAELKVKDAKITRMTGEREEALKQWEDAIFENARQDATRWEQTANDLKRLLAQTKEEKEQLQCQLRESKAREFELQCQVDHLERNKQNHGGSRSRASSSSEDEESGGVSQSPRDHQQLGRTNSHHSGKGHGSVKVAEIRWDKNAKWFSRSKR